MCSCVFLSPFVVFVKSVRECSGCGSLDVLLIVSGGSGGSGGSVCVEVVGSISFDIVMLVWGSNCGVLVVNDVVSTS